MLRMLIVFFVFIPAMPRIASACSCPWLGQFEEYAGQSAAVILGEVTSYGEKLPHGETLHASMTVKPIRVIKGNISHESITLWGDPGHLCREYVDSSRLRIGQQYLIALHNSESEQAFGGCGEAWLRVDGGNVVGLKQTDEGYQEYSVPMDELQSNLQAKD